MTTKDITTSTGHKYLVITSRLRWVWAQDVCRSFGTNLVTLWSDQQAAALHVTMRADPSTREHYWIGLSDEGHEGIWQWADGSSSSLSYWCPGEPNGGTNENCAAFPVHDEKWFDIHCHSRFIAICAPTGVDNSSVLCGVCGCVRCSDNKQCNGCPGNKRMVLCMQAHQVRQVYQRRRRRRRRQQVTAAATAC